MLKLRAQTRDSRPEAAHRHVPEVWFTSAAGGGLVGYRSMWNQDAMAHTPAAWALDVRAASCRPPRPAEESDRSHHHRALPETHGRYPTERDPRMDTPLTMLRQVVTQDVARGNAAQACVHLMHQRRQREHVDAYLSARLGRPAHPPADGSAPAQKLSRRSMPKRP